MARWTCPECHRQFGRRSQGHECAPALTLDEYFSTGPPHERPVFDAVEKILGPLEDIYIEPVSVGVFFKVHTTFVQLRPMTRWIALSIALARKLTDEGISRKPIKFGDRWYHVINVHKPAEIDEVVEDWLLEAYDFEINRHDRRPGAGNQ